MTSRADAFSEAFAILSDETRLEVIRVLGDVGGTEGDHSLSFSELQKRVGVQDNGRFNYHLQELLGRFVEPHDDGYRLRIPGVQVYQAIQAGVYAEHDEIGPLETDIPCPGDCEATCHGEYTEFRFRLACPDCGARRVHYPVDPESFDPEAVPEDLLRAADRRLKRDTFSMELGFCPYCAGPVESAFLGHRSRFSESEADEGLVASRRSCTRCHWFIEFRTHALALIKPRVAGAFSAAGVNTFETPQWDAAYEWTETVVSEDPVRIALEMTIGGITRCVTFDADLAVVGID